MRLVSPASGVVCWRESDRETSQSPPAAPTSAPRSPRVADANVGSTLPPPRKKHVRGVKEALNRVSSPSNSFNIKKKKLSASGLVRLNLLPQIFIIEITNKILKTFAKVP